MARYKTKFDRMTANELHMKLKPAVKVLSISYVLTFTGQHIFPGKAFELLEFSFNR